MRRKYKLYSVKDFAKMKFKDLIKYIPKDDWVTASTIGDIFSSERDAILFILGYLVGEGKLHAVIRQYINGVGALRRNIALKNIVQLCRLLLNKMSRCR